MVKVQEQLNELKRLGWPMTHLAEKTNVSKATLYRWVEGEDPQQIGLVQIALQSLIDAGRYRNTVYSKRAK